MTLKEKFKIINCTDCDIPYCDVKCTILAPSELYKLVKIAENFAIDFAEWILRKPLKILSQGEYWDSFFEKRITTKELLEIYKEENGL